MEKKDIEIPFGAFDSELGGFEYTIPEGYKAEIKDGKVVVRKTETEDEMIKKEITELVMQPTWKTEKEFNRRNELCVWLEKQVEHANFRNKIQIGDKVTRNEDGILVNLSQLNRVAKKNEKQDEQKPVQKIEPTPIFKIGDILKRKGKDYTFRVDRIQGGYYHCDRNHGAFFPIEEQGNWELVEQNPADKVEPKFHEGEWLCENEPNNYARFIQILEIVNVQGKDRYRISRDIHNDEDIVEFDFVEKYYHKFDIQDAKDGDVLADDYGIYIFDKFDKEDERCFLCIGTYQYSQKVYEDRHMLCSINVRPATKEQRDLLFAKMKEEGYEWDVEKKELKRIEQKKNIEGTFINVDEVRENFIKEVYRVLANDTTNDRANDIIYYFDSLPTIYLHTNKPLPSDGDDFDMNYILKPSWSEEDDGVLLESISVLQNSSHWILADKLKSIINRIQPQPQQEWSEEDDIGLYDALWCCKQAVDTARNENEMGNCWYAEKWLKALKDRCIPQPHWKPSDEQMQILHWCMPLWVEPKSKAILESLINDLKKLKE